MHIFVDESGSFTIPKERKGPSISCAGAVILPSAEAPTILADLQRLSGPWADASGEVKGRMLNETRVDSFLSLLAERGCLIDCVAIDLGLHCVAEVQEHQQVQASKLTANLIAEHHPNLVQEVRALAGQLSKLSVPEYIQLVTYTRLVDAIIRNKTIYIVQRRPSDIQT
ncbi:MAG: hypothetical protein QJR07_14600 [Acetobacteraceae bacterium]|nr:hypothetical protein [Acetobacteraceae bacterium]